MSFFASGGYQPWIFALTAGLAIAMLAWGVIAGSAAALNPMRRRLASLRDGEGTSLARPAQPGFWSMFEPAGEEARTRLRMHLAQGGIRFKGAGGAYRFARIVSLVLLPLVTQLVIATFLAAKVSPPMAVLIAMGAALLGWLLPEMVLERLTENRKARLMEGFPDALDLLVACTEAGLSFNAALERVVEQMPASQPDLAEELGQVNAEIRAGLDRTQALRNLAERTGLDEIRGLVSLITHSTRLGTGIAGTLRIYAEEFRDRRMQRAEEIAATVGTKLIFPLTVFLFPSFFVVVVGPAVISVMRALAAHPLVH